MEKGLNAIKGETVGAGNWVSRASRLTLWSDDRSFTGPEVSRGLHVDHEMLGRFNRSHCAGNSVPGDLDLAWKKSH